MLVILWFALSEAGATGSTPGTPPPADLYAFCTCASNCCLTEQAASADEISPTSGTRS